MFLFLSFFSLWSWLWYVVHDNLLSKSTSNLTIILFTVNYKVYIFQQGCCHTSESFPAASPNLQTKRRMLSANLNDIHSIYSTLLEWGKIVYRGDRTHNFALLWYVNREHFQSWSMGHLLHLIRCLVLASRPPVCKKKNHRKKFLFKCTLLYHDNVMMTSN